MLGVADPAAVACQVMKRLGIVVLVLIVALTAFLYFPRGGAVADAANSATLAVVRGDVDSMHRGTSFAPALNGDLLASGDVVRSNSQGLGVLSFFDGSTVTIEQGSEVAVTALSRVGSDGINVTLGQTLGRTWSSVQKLGSSSQFQIKTPSATAAVRGTGFEVVVAVVGGILTTTVTVHEGAVLVTADAGGSVLVTAGTFVVIPLGATAPAAPTPLAQTATLRFVAAAGLGYDVTDPRGLACGGGVREIPGCTVAGASVTIVDPVPGRYVVTMTAAAAVNGRLLTVGDVSFSGAVAPREFVRLTTVVAVDGPRVAVGPLSLLAKLANACGAESAGRIFAGGAASESFDAARAFAAANDGQSIAVVVTERQLADIVAGSISSSNSPIPASDVSVKIDGAGVGGSAAGSLGPLTLKAAVRVIAGARSGNLTLRLAELNAGILPPAFQGQLGSVIQAQLDEFAASFPMNVERVTFKPGCVAFLGTTR